MLVALTAVTLGYIFFTLNLECVSLLMLSIFQLLAVRWPCGPVVIAGACPHLVPVLFSVVVSTVMYVVSLLHMVDIIAI